MDSDGGCQPRPQTTTTTASLTMARAIPPRLLVRSTAGLDGPIDGLCLDRTGSVGRWDSIKLLQYCTVLYCKVGAYFYTIVYTRSLAGLLEEEWVHARVRSRRGSGEVMTCGWPG